MSAIAGMPASAHFRGGLSAAQTHDGLKQALGALASAEKNAVLWFAEILRRKLYRELGYSSIHVYASEALGFTRSKTSQFLRLADSLRELPELRRSVASGSLSWTKAREVAKVATPGTEKEWIAQARTQSSRELESAVRLGQEQARAAARPAGAQGSLLDGGGQDSPELPTPAAGAVPIPNPLAAEFSKRLNLRFRPEECARFQALVEKLRKTSRSEEIRRAGWESLILLGLEALLASGEKPADAGTASKRQGLTTGGIAAPGNGVPSSELGASTDLRPSEFTRVKSGTPYQIVIYRCERCQATVIKTGRGDQPLSEASYERIACDARILAHGEKNRATIPPAVRRAVLARDGHRCRITGCGKAAFLEVHHVIPRHEGGSNRPENLVTTCRDCHQLLHEKKLAGPLADLLVPIAPRAKVSSAEDRRSGCP